MSEQQCPFGHFYGCKAHCALYINGKGCAIRVLAENMMPVTIEANEIDVIPEAQSCVACKYIGHLADTLPCNKCSHTGGDASNYFQPK